MTTKKTFPTSSDDKSQLDKFKEAARELECDNDEDRFREQVGKLVRPESKKPKAEK